METAHDIIREAKRSLAPLPLQPVDIDPALRHIAVPGGSIDLEVYTADKFEKVVLCGIRIFETGVVESSLLAWPGLTAITIFRFCGIKKLLSQESNAVTCRPSFFVTLKKKLSA